MFLRTEIASTAGNPPAGIQRVAALVDRTVIVAAAVLTALGATSVLLGWLGWMRPIPLLIVGGLVASPLVIAARRLRLPSGDGQWYWLNLALALTLVVLAGLNAANSSEHLLVDSDPGIYANAARHLANEGSLVLDPAAGPFAAVDGLAAWGAGQYDVREDGKIYFQFFHFLSGLMAIGGWVGGNLLLLRTPALVAGLSSLLFHLLARSFMRPGLAAALTLAMALNPVQVFFSRDSYSEISTQMLALFGLVALTSAIRHPRLAAHALAGVALGATTFSRIDAPLITVPASIIGVALLHRAQGSQRRGAAVFLGALISVGSLGLVLGRWISPVYWEHISGLLYPMLVIQLLVLAGGTATLLVRRRVIRSVSQRLRQRSMRALAGAGAIGFLATATFALYIRPRVLVGHFGESRALIANELAQVGLEPDPTRNMAELSLQWITWYIGVPAVLVGLVGLALALWYGLVRADSALLALASVVSVSLVIRVIRPSIVPVHYWAMRRFYDVVIPGLLLLAGWAVTELSRRLGERGVRVALAAVLVVPTFAVIGTLQIDSWAHRQQISFRSSALRLLCDPNQDQAFLMVDYPGGGPSPANYLTMFRTFCGSEAVRLVEPTTPAALDTLALEWQADGVELILVSTEGVTPLLALGVPGCAIASTAAINDKLPETTLLSPPRHTVYQQIPFYYAPAIPDCS